MVRNANQQANARRRLIPVPSPPSGNPLLNGGISRHQWRRPILVVAAAFAVTAAVLGMVTVPFLVVVVEETPDPLRSALEEMHRTSAASVHNRLGRPAAAGAAQVESQPQQTQQPSQSERREDHGELTPPNLLSDEAQGDEDARRAGDTVEAEAAARAEAAAPAETNEVPDAVADEEDKFHLVFSTGCSPFQNWQSYVFFHRAMVVRQPGLVTRIVSGCDSEQQNNLQSFFDEHIATMTSGDGSAKGDFRIHFTPDYSNVKEGEYYPYFNKPFGVRHWMENVLGYTNRTDASHMNENEHDNTIVVLLDPDEMLLRPFAKNDFSDSSWVRPFQQREIEQSGGDAPSRNEARWTRVDHGKPIGQLYGYDLQWKRKINMTLLVPPDGPTSPVDDMSDFEAKEGYVVGPPLLATAHDLYKIVTQWTQFAPLVHDQYPHLLAEMFAYSLAAAHLRLSHQTSTSLMVSDVTSSLFMEDWSYVDGLDTSTLCRHDVNPTAARTVNQSEAPIPHVLHYCQDYGIGYWFFSKYHFPENFLSCEHPLFRIPPADLAESALSSNQTYYYVPPRDLNVTFKPRGEVIRNAFAACTVLRAINGAVAHFKSRHCSADAANLNETFTFHDSDKYPPL